MLYRGKEKTACDGHGLIAAVKQRQVDKFISFIMCDVKLRLSFFSLSFFLLVLSIKSGDVYQLGRGISPDTRPPILYHVMCFVQRERGVISNSVISTLIV